MALTVAVFILGGVLGGLGTYLAGHMHEGHRRQRFLDRLSRQLQLTPDQRSKVESILVQGHRRITAVYWNSQKEARPQYDAVHADIRNQIRAVLTPAQQPKFDAFLKRLDEERRAREARHSRPHR